MTGRRQVELLADEALWGPSPELRSEGEALRQDPALRQEVAELDAVIGAITSALVEPEPIPQAIRDRLVARVRVDLARRAPDPQDD